MKTLFSTLICCFFCLLIQAQKSVKDYYPSSFEPLEFSAEGEKEFLESLEHCEEVWNLDYEEMSEKQKQTAINCEMGSYFSAAEGGCSWYCGGGPDSLSASSVLATQGKVNYEAQNAHDGDYKTVWVEGAKGDGIGEYLAYYFDPFSPRVNTIIITNGYIKSKKAWKDNSRVKTLKLSVDDKAFAILHLEDKMGVQTFKIPPIGYSNEEEENLPEDAPLMVLKFEIMEVYKGDKYDDTVISELLFDGLDVHCLAKGTNITMADQTTKKIEALQIGDQILSFNAKNKAFEASTILSLASPLHENLIKIRFANGDSLLCTKDHPLLSKNGQWTSFDADKTQRDYALENVQSLVINTAIQTSKGTSKIISIQELPQTQQTYTIVKLDKNNTFIANGIVVGIETLRTKL